MTQDEMIELAKQAGWQTEPIQSLQCFHCQVTIETLNDKVMHLLAERTPAQRTWVGLTKQQRNNIEDICETIIGEPAFNAIEAQLKENNT
jgi:hypothetical protein